MYSLVVVHITPGADLGILLWWGCDLESHADIRLLVAGEQARGSGSMPPPGKILNFHVSVDQFKCILRAI